MIKPTAIKKQVAKEGEKKREDLDEIMFEQKRGQAAKAPSEKDRARLIRNVADNFMMSPEQAVGLAAEVSFFPCFLSLDLLQR